MSVDDLGERQTSTSSPGAQLAQAREERGVSQREIADALNLPIHVVDAIEAGDKERLPAHVFTRGYVRAYAKLLELDPDPLVTAFTFEYADKAEEQPRPVQATNPYVQYRGMIAAGIGLVVVLLLSVWLFSGGDGESPDGLQGDGSVVPQAADTPGAVPGATSVSAYSESTDSLSTGEPEADAPALSSTASAEEADLMSESVSGSPEVVNAGGDSLVTNSAEAEDDVFAGTHRRLTMSGSETLELVFAEDCWVEIKNGDGTTLFADLGRSGREFRFVGQGPFQIVLGYAPGVFLSYNNEVVALAPHTRNNVASVVLGQ